MIKKENIQLLHWRIFGDSVDIQKDTKSKNKNIFLL
jgi:hypothetical protein